MRPPRSLLGRWFLMASAAVLVAAPATSAAPWGEPQVLAGGHLGFWKDLGFEQVPGLLDFAPQDNGAAVLTTDAGGDGVTRFDVEHGTFGPVRASAFAGVHPTQMALYGRRGIMVAGPANGKGDPVDPLTGRPLDVAVARGALTGGVLSRQILAAGVGEFRRDGRTVPGTAEPALLLALAANANGDAAAAVSVPVKGGSRVAGHRVRLLVRPRWRPSFRRVADYGPVTVGHSPVALAVNGPGDVLFAWDDREGVRARVVTAAGRVGREQRLGQGGSAWLGGNRMSAAIDAHRRMLVGWVAQRVGEGNYAGSPGTVSVAYAPAHRGFAPAQVLERGLRKGMDRGIGLPGVVVRLVPGGGVAAWTGWDGTHRAVRAADLPGGRAARAVVLSPAGAGADLDGLVASSGGGVVAGWTTTGPPAAITALVRPAGATAWGPPEPIVTFPPGGFLTYSVPLAVEPISGRVVILWSDPVAFPLPGSTPAPPPVRYRVRATP